MIEVTRSDGVTVRWIRNILTVKADRASSIGVLYSPIFKKNQWFHSDTTRQRTDMLDKFYYTSCSFILYPVLTRSSASVGVTYICGTAVPTLYNAVNILTPFGGYNGSIICRSTFL